MLSNIELTEVLKTLQSAMEDLVKEKLMNQQIIEDMLIQLQTVEHEVKILKRTIGMGNLELIPTADYELSADTDPHNSGSQICGFPGCKRCYPDVDPELSADTCPHLNWDRDYENDIRICKNCGHQEALY